MEGPPQLQRDSDEAIQLLKTLRQRSTDHFVRKIIDGYVPTARRVAELDEVAKRLNAEANYLTGLAAVASLIASVQIGFLPLISNPDCGVETRPDSCGAHAIFIRALINFFSYLALSLDVLGALSLLLTGRSLSQVSSDIQVLKREKYRVDRSVIRWLDHPDSQLPDTLRSEIDDLYGHVARQLHIVKDHTGGAQGVLALVLLGMVCFFVALILQVIQSQPVKFWIPFVVLMAVMAIILGANEKRRRPGMWFSLKRRHWRRATDTEAGGQVETDNDEGGDRVAQDIPSQAVTDAKGSVNVTRRTHSSTTTHPGEDNGDLQAPAVNLDKVLERAADASPQGGGVDAAVQSASTAENPRGKGGGGT